MAVYFGIAILIFIGVIAYAAYAEEYPGGSYFRPNKGDHQALITLIAPLIALFWPFTIRLKEKHESTN